jgi:hypothetical protein
LLDPLFIVTFLLYFTMMMMMIIPHHQRVGSSELPMSVPKL